MKKKFLTIIPIIPIVLFLYHTSWAYDGEVHFKINEAAVRSSQLDSVLSNQIGIDNGIDAELTKGSQKKEIWDWIAYGGEAAFGLIRPPAKNGRSRSHFLLRCDGINR